MISAVTYLIVFHSCSSNAIILNFGCAPQITVVGDGMKMIGRCLMFRQYTSNSDIITFTLPFLALNCSIDRSSVGGTFKSERSKISMQMGRSFVSWAIVRVVEG